MRHAIVPLRSGWDQGCGDAFFYPEDLPEEWRLTYFSNELQGVVVEPQAWVPVEPARLREWTGEVSSTFRFYLRSPVSPPCSQACRRARQALGSHFGGWILWHALDIGADLEIADDAPIYREIEAESEVPAEAAALAWEVPASARADLRGGRAWLEDYARVAAGRPALALMGTASVETVKRWQALIQLLGLG
ncbi:hypothetical protein CKO25_02285 [Thiocapsa imhoffii]|uniref:DUF72 domain-containing protein n=1 Tax=Thiocapsa imhoffii TaxID=382777 RepID=A0A9X1B7Q4_9GAMM|nr:hypothetical protein [Thiocapsa imhoffii]MBK1643503.1 hypothetical protein [Thiocapsa imhoffii]